LLDFDRAALEAAKAKCERLAKRLEQVNQSWAPLVRVFGETEVVPAEMKRRCRELNDEPFCLEVDRELATRRLHDVWRACCGRRPHAGRERKRWEAFDAGQGIKDPRRGG